MKLPTPNCNFHPFEVPYNEPQYFIQQQLLTATSILLRHLTMNHNILETATLTGLIFYLFQSFYNDRTTMFYITANSDWSNVPSFRGILQRKTTFYINASYATILTGQIFHLFEASNNEPQYGMLKTAINIDWPNIPSF